MEKFTGWKKEGRAHYSIWVAGELIANASNPTVAAEKLEKEVNRHAMNAQREVSNLMWSASQAEREYSFAERVGMVTA